MAEDLVTLRGEIDAIDDRLVDLLAERMAVAHRVAAVKRANGLPVLLPDRITEVKERVAARAAAAGLDPVYVTSLYAAIIDETCRVEEALIGAAEARGAQEGGDDGG